MIEYATFTHRNVVRQIEVKEVDGGWVAEVQDMNVAWVGVGGGKKMATVRPLFYTLAGVHASRATAYANAVLAIVERADAPAEEET